jgi:protein MpaA
VLRRRSAWLLAAPLLIASAGAGEVAPATDSRSDAVAPRRAAATVGAARVERLGTSVRGRAIDAVEVGTARRRRADLLVVGCIHGNEPAGIAVAQRLRGMLASQPVDAWIVNDLNPDGRAANTRVNAHRVDLNRNFPWRWQPRFRPGDLQYSGPRVLSEPESRAAHRLILRVRPRVAIWFHQALTVVDDSGGRPAVERRFSRLSGLPLRRLPRYHGSAVSWENQAVPGSTAFVVELPGGRLSARAVERMAKAAAAVAG